MTLEYDMLNAKIKIAQKDHHHIIHWAQTGTYYEGKETEIITKGNKKFAKIWLLEAQHVNGNGWGVSPVTLAQNITKFKGRPYVITASQFLGKPSVYEAQFVHPNIPTNDVRKVLNHQETFRVGTIIDVMEEGQNWFAMIEILPKYAQKSLPPFCSPAVYQLDAREDPTNFTKWEPLHLAGLMEKPAYGARLATLRGTCIGTANECKIQFTRVAQLDGRIMCANMQKANKYKSDKLHVSMKLAQIRLGAEFNEKDHPRGKDGEFTSGSGGSKKEKVKPGTFGQGNAPTKGPSNLSNDVVKQQKAFDSALGDYIKSLKGEHASASLNESHFREVFRKEAVKMGNRVKKATGEFPEGFEAVKQAPDQTDDAVKMLTRIVFDGEDASGQSDIELFRMIKARGFNKTESKKAVEIFREQQKNK
jgi:hypothetical protein